MSLDDDDLKKGEQKNRYVIVKSNLDGDAGVKFFEPWSKYARFFSGVFDDTTVGADHVVKIMARRARTLPYLAEYLEHRSNSFVHKPALLPVPSKQVVDSVQCQWCASFIDSISDLDDFFDLQVIANYVSCEGLAVLCAVKFASMMVGRQKPNLRRWLGCADDYTPQEEAEARATHPDLVKDCVPVDDTAVEPEGKTADVDE
jgi:hypothetical protein